MRTIRQFFRRLKRLIQFIPYIWKGVDYDYRSAIDLFSYQLSRTADFLESDKAYSTAALQDASRIRTAVDLLERVYEGEYDIEYVDQMKAIYGPDVLDFWFEDTGDGTGSKYLRTLYEKWDNADEVEAKLRELQQISHNKQEKAHALVWNFIAHNIRHWWD